MDGMVVIFVVYDLTTNAILATPVKNVAEGTLVSFFKQKITYFTKEVSNPSSASSTMWRQKQCKRTLRPRMSIYNVWSRTTIG